MGYMSNKEAKLQLPEHVTLCPDGGRAPAHDLTIPKWVFKQVGDCYCADPMESPSEGFAMDYRREIHSYLVEKGEREE